MEFPKQFDLTGDPDSLPYVKDEIVNVKFAKYDGVIASREGPNRYHSGDALITSSTGDCWSVSRDRFDTRYTPLTQLPAGSDGEYRAMRVTVMAKQMDRAFSIARSAGGDVLQGKAKDWLLQYAPGDFGIVENERFQRVYHPVQN